MTTMRDDLVEQLNIFGAKYGGESQHIGTFGQIFGNRSGHSLRNRDAVK